MNWPKMINNDYFNVELVLAYVDIPSFDRRAPVKGITESGDFILGEIIKDSISPHAIYKIINNNDGVVGRINLCVVEGEIRGIVQIHDAFKDKYIRWFAPSDDAFKFFESFKTTFKEEKSTHKYSIMICGTDYAYSDMIVE